MKDFLLNWNYKKQIIAEAMCYSCMAMVGNAWLGKKPSEKEKTLCPAKIYRQMPLKQKCFNCALLGCFAIDMTASYFLLRYFKRKLV